MNAPEAPSDYHCPDPSLRFVVVGPGAMGILFAQALSRAGQPTTLLGRQHTSGKVLLPPDVVNLDGSRERLRVPVTDDPAVAQDAEVVLLLVKTFNTGEAMARIAEFLRPGAIVLSLQNGLGNAEVISAQVEPGLCVLVGVTSQAAMRLTDGAVAHTGIGPTIIGYQSPRDRVAAERISRVFHVAGIPTAVSGDIARLVWQKVAVNAAINGLTALGEFPNGRIAERPDLQHAADIIVDEVAAVARAEGVELSGIRQTLQKVVLDTAANRSSMLQDIDAGRPTEVDAIHGAVIAAGQRHGLFCPAITTIAALIRAKARTEAELESGS